MRRCTFLLPILCAVIFLGCTKTPEKKAPPSSGATELEPEESAAYAVKLSYTEPSSSGWRFSKVSGTGSDSDPLILELRGPDGKRVKGMSMSLNLSQDTISLHPLLDSSYVIKSPGIDLGSGQPLCFDKLEGSTLHCGVFQKTGDADAGQGIFRIALKLKDDAQPIGQITGISILKKALLDGAGQQTSPSIAFGALQAE